MDARVRRGLLAHTARGPATQTRRYPARFPDEQTLVAGNPAASAAQQTSSRLAFGLHVGDPHVIGPGLDVLEHLRLRLRRSDDPHIAAEVAQPRLGFRLLRHFQERAADLVLDRLRNAGWDGDAPPAHDVDTRHA